MTARRVPNLDLRFAQASTHGSQTSTVGVEGYLMDWAIVTPQSVQGFVSRDVPNDYLPALRWQLLIPLSARRSHMLTVWVERHT